MFWTRVFMLSLLTTLLIFIFSSVVESAAVRDNSKAAAVRDNSKAAAVRDNSKASDPKGPARQVFMPESDASNFFKRRSRRSTHYYELQAEQRVKITASERRREYNEEQLDEYEHYVEEERDEQNERTRETNEQMREYHYDGLEPRYYWFH